jgi:hypothetical protein
MEDPNNGRHLMNDESDQKAVSELTAMANTYVDRGQLDKAAELLHLAEKISRRLYESNIIEMDYWQRQLQPKRSKDIRA